MRDDQISDKALALLRNGVRHFLDDEAFDRMGFAELVRSLHELPLAERKVVYEYMLHETLSTEHVTDEERAGALVRLADLVGQEPPAIGAFLGPRIEVLVDRIEKRVGERPPRQEPFRPAPRAAEA